MLPIGIEGRSDFAGVFVGQDARNMPRVLNVFYSRARQDADIGVELIVDFRTIFYEEPVADGLPSHVTRQQHALGAVDRDPTRHRLIHRTVFHERIRRDLAIHVEVHRDSGPSVHPVPNWRNSTPCIWTCLNPWRKIHA